MFVQVHFDTYVKEKWNFLNSQCSLFGHPGCGSGLVPHLQTREVTGRWAYYFLQPVQTQTRKRTWGPSLSFLFSFIEVIAILKWSKLVHANYLSKEQNSKWSKSCHGIWFVYTSRLFEVCSVCAINVKCNSSGSNFCVDHGPDRNSSISPPLQTEGSDFFIMGIKVVFIMVGKHSNRTYMQHWLKMEGEWIFSVNTFGPWVNIYPLITYAIAKNLKKSQHSYCNFRFLQ